MSNLVHFWWSWSLRYAGLSSNIIAVIFNTKPLDSKYLWMSFIPRPHPACTLLPVYWKWSTLGSVWGLGLRLYIYHRSGNFRVAYNFCHAAKWWILNACVTIFRTFNFRRLSNWRKIFMAKISQSTVYIFVCATMVRTNEWKTKI